MNVLTSDWEVTTFAKGNPFSKKNKAVCLGYKLRNDPPVCLFDLTPFDLTPYLNVFFNAKFDLHWYRRLGFALPSAVWCCQLAEFILGRQQHPYPSLEETAQKYGLGNKIDVIETDYWDKGIDTDAIPPDILGEYCKQDVSLTYAIYLRQQELFIQKPGLYKLFKLACQDLLILEEMEWNGLVYDEELCKKRIKECQEQMQVHLNALRSVYPNTPINFNSGDQLSCFLYGGTIIEDIKLPDGVYKTGMKKGQPKFKNGTTEHVLPRMVEPLPKTELAKPGYWATNEPTLKKLKGPFAKKYVEHILGVAKQDKLIGTYYEGIPKLNREKDWEPGVIHGQLNQCVAATGRLSASQPNQQNFANDIQDIFISRYE
jgi:DNA polymerase I-like protein with 3'-5' exonuclease and polymerase domains